MCCCVVVAGMFGLSKTEMKKDTKEIEKHSDFTVSDELWCSIQQDVMSDMPLRRLLAYDGLQ